MNGLHSGDFQCFGVYHPSAGSLKIVTKHSLRFAPGICTTIPSKVTPLGARERSSLSLNLLFCSSSVGSLLLQQISLVDNGVLDKTEETPDEILVDFWI
jgi:hypothetical protein